MQEEAVVATVSVLGLGAMGSRLAQVLVAGGHEVTVWNRGRLGTGRAARVAGARLVASSAAAAAAAPLVLMCVLDYAAADEVLSAPGVLPALAGRTLVQLTNGSVPEVRAQMGRAAAAGAHFLCGSIAGYPRHMGRPEAVILYSGDEAAFREHEHTLAGLAGAQRYLGADPELQNATYVAAFGYYYAALGGFLESAALAAARGVPVAEFAAAMPAMTALLLDHIDDAARRLTDGDLGGDQASVDVHLAGSARRRQAFAEHCLQSRFTDAFTNYLRQAHEAGAGERDIAALFSLMTAPPAAG